MIEGWLLSQILFPPNIPDELSAKINHPPILSAVWYMLVKIKIMNRFFWTSSLDMFADILTSNKSPTHPACRNLFVLLLFLSACY